MRGKSNKLSAEPLTGEPSALRTNFVSDRPSRLVCRAVSGATACAAATSSCSALATKRRRARRWRLFPAACRSGGGIHLDNAAGWLDAGASHVIVTSWIFAKGRAGLGAAQAIGRRRRQKTGWCWISVAARATAALFCRHGSLAEIHRTGNRTRTLWRSWRMVRRVPGACGGRRRALPGRGFGVGGKTGAMVAAAGDLRRRRQFLARPGRGDAAGRR